MKLSLYSDRATSGSIERLNGEICWSDLQWSARVVWTEDGQPVRQIAPRSRLPVGRYNSRKAGRMLHHQSRGHGHVGGEKLALMICEIDPAVVDFRSQHIRFDLLIDGATQTYFPDIVALTHDGTVRVIEVKKDARWQSDSSYSRKLATVQDICGDLDWRFEVWTQASMAPSPRIRDNITHIQMQRFIEIDEAQMWMVSRAFHRKHGQLSVGEIKRMLGGSQGAGDLVRGLMCRGMLGLPLNERICDETIATMFERCDAPRLEHAA